MRRTIVVLIMIIVVAVVLAGGAAFILEQNKMDKLKRATAEAQEMVENKKYEDALPILKNVESQGGTARSTFLLGKTYYEQGKPQEAMPYFSRVESKYASSSYLPLAMLYKGRYALEAEGQPKKAKETFVQILQKYPNSEAVDWALYYLGRISYEEGDLVQTKKNLEQIMKRPDSPARGESEFLLGDINMKQLKSPEPGPGDELYTIKRGDSVWKLERSLKVPADLIVGINGLNPKALTVGEQIKVPRLNLSIMVDKAQRTLTLLNHGQFFKKYRVAINRNNNLIPTNTDYSVTEKYDKGYEYTDPETNTIIKPGDPNNPLGTRFLQLRRDMGIHGTNKPDGLGQYCNKGYIAMANSDIEELYALVRKGTPVHVKNKNLLEGSSPGSKD